MMTVDEKDVEGAGHVKAVVVDHEKRFDGVSDLPFPFEVV